ncbi:rRNA methyltransferase [Asticcacaulis sp. AC460]|uniref:23S rRNA (guanosine(2251)-2'-O)-methyltransferase RlmB n=1 Tax=Asticcacaulis sp. AC460 TaxID=1282360 RepID=UPI0003C3AC8B|nr:23S rRNA (guanosine(2251)-2'-O)-methyltransferase RlmB [Asticcacaulis sp. AC460]ESQ89261.1 rRNA methyltransferase [Asticcacaulis sp. AC460]
MSSNRERNDPKRPKSKNRPEKFSGRPRPPETQRPRQAENSPKPQSFQKSKVNDDGWLWGVHAVEAALKNVNRPGPLKLFLSEDRAQTIAPALLKRSGLKISTLLGPDIARMLPQGAVHQGIALHGPVLEGEPLEALMESGDGVILMLDQVTDPQNIGAIFRSAAAFGVTGLVMQDRHSPPLQGVLAKTAAGAVDMVPFSRVTNLSRSLEVLGENGYVSVGLAGEGEFNLHTLLEQQGWGGSLKKLVLVLGSEGEGLRRLVAEHCDHLARIPMPGGFESLNVSHAASISLYEALARTT